MRQRILDEQHHGGCRRDGDTTPEPGSTFDWVLKVTNNGPAIAQSVVVSDAVPGRVTVLAVTSVEFVCSIAGNLVTCTKDSMAVGEVGTVGITVRVATDLPGQSIENVGTVSSSTHDPDVSNNSASNTVLTQMPIAEAAPPVPPAPVDAGPGLPITGTDIAGAVGLAGLLLLGGLALAVLRRRLRPA